MPLESGRACWREGRAKSQVVVSVGGVNSVR